LNAEVQELKKRLVVGQKGSVTEVETVKKNAEKHVNNPELMKNLEVGSEMVKEEQLVDENCLRDSILVKRSRCFQIISSCRAICLAQMDTAELSLESCRTAPRFLQGVSEQSDHVISPPCQLCRQDNDSFRNDFHFLFLVATTKTID
jgi:hypothetical protein